MLHRLSTVFLYFGLILGKECPVRVDQGVPNFTTDQTADFISVRYGHYAELECCMSGYDEIMWFKLNKDKGEWEVYNISDVDQYRVDFFNNRQIMAFKSAEFGDEGTYMCHPRRNETVFKDISRKFSMEVQSCDSLARGPYAIAPLPCENTISTVGEDVTLPCNAYFGCGDGDEPRLVSWYVTHDHTGESDWTPVAEFDSRFSVKSVESGNKTEIRTNLTIMSVKQDDFSLKFRCMLASAQVVHGQTDIYVKLVNSEKDVPTKMETETASITLIAVAAAAFFVFIVIIFIAVTVEQGRRTRKHVSNDITRKISTDMRPLNYAEV